MSQLRLHPSFSIVAAAACALIPAGLTRATGAAQLPDMRSENVAAIAVAPDGRVVATGERAAVVKLWDAETRTLERTLPAHKAQVSALAFSPDGRWLVSGSFDEWIHVWDVATGRPIRTLSDHPGHVKSLAFSSDGGLLAATGADGVHVWELPAGRLRHALPNPRGVVAAVFSPDGRLLASAGGDGVKLWDAATAARVRTLESGAGELILALAFSPDGRSLAGGGTGRVAHLWDVASGARRGGSAAGGDAVRALAFSGDGSSVVVADRTGARVWETATGAMRSTLEGARFSAVTLSSDGRAFAAAVGDGAVKVLPID